VRPPRPSGVDGLQLGDAIAGTLGAFTQLVGLALLGGLLVGFDPLGFDHGDARRRSASGSGALTPVSVGICSSVMGVTLNNHEFWRGGNMYLSGLTDQLMSKAPVVGPAVNSTAERAESGDVSGAATDVAAALALENAPAIVRGTGKVAGKTAEVVGDVAGKAGEKIGELKPEALTKRPETPAPQHGAPVKVESPLDGPTVGKQSTLTDSGLGEGKLLDDIEALKKNLPASDAEKLAKDVDGVLKDANKALNSTDPNEVLEYRRQLGQKIDWDAIEKNPSTPTEVQNAARAKVYRAIGEKIHSEIPDTIPLDKELQPHLELRSHMRSKLGERVVDDPLAAKAEAQSELKKGQTTIDNALHNEKVQRNWKVVKAGLIAAGIGTGALAKVGHLFGD
jgi:hypothetical protein